MKENVKSIAYDIRVDYYNVWLMAVKSGVKLLFFVFSFPFNLNILNLSWLDVSL